MSWPRWYTFDGMPARVQSPRHVPEVYRDGRWVPFYDRFRFDHEAMPVDEEKLDRLRAMLEGGTE